MTPSFQRPVVTESRATLGDQLASLERCQHVLRQHTGASASIAGFVPGRIEVLGKHVDYAGGRSIVCAVDRGFAFAALPRRDNTIRAFDASREVARETVLDAAHRDHSGDWGAYISTLARRLARDSASPLAGVDIVFSSNLPSASGLSSSTALLITVFLAVAQANAWFEGSSLGQLLRGEDRLVLADYLAAVESGKPFAALAGDSGVGTLGGSQDHTAILSARSDYLSRFAFLPTQLLGEHRVTSDVTFAVAFSGVHAEKTGAARELYNNASRMASEIVRLWYEATANDTVQSLRDLGQLDSRGFAGVRDVLRERSSVHFSSRELQHRLEQFLAEDALHDSACAALNQQDWVRFGDLAAESQRNAERLLGNQTRETSYLAQTGRELDAFAASAFGAGFGGSVWALVRADEASGFLERWRAAYARRFPDQASRATFFVSRPSAAARYIA